jgi:hypothetical protein
MTGVFVQTTPFVIEYGDYRDIKPTSSSETKAETKTQATPKTQKKRRQK